MKLSRKPLRPMRRFLDREDGSATIETVIWIPIFVWFLAFAVNTSMIFFEKNQAYRVVQDANRILSIGSFQTAQQVQDFIRSSISHITPEASVTTTISDGVVTSDVSYQVADLFLPGLIEEQLDFRIHIRAAHFVEY